MPFISVPLPLDIDSIPVGGIGIVCLRKVCIPVCFACSVCDPISSSAPVGQCHLQDQLSRKFKKQQQLVF